MKMNGPDITEWARDCKFIGTAARRYAYASKCLPTDEVRAADDILDAAVKAFAAKYAIDRESAENIAYIVSDGVALGLAY